jgi:FdhD protein
MSRSTTPHEVLVVQENAGQAVPDSLATEEPLEIRLTNGGETNPIAVTMRTPGHDRELALGFLYGEGVVRTSADVVAMDRPVDRAGRPEDNIIRVELAPGIEPDLRGLDRHFFTSSACGVCGKAGIEALLLKKVPEPRRGPRVRPEVLYTLPESLRSDQDVFRSTGGLHAAGLYRADGEQVAVREDVGRHNALDKLVGTSLSADRLPLDEYLVMVSGRASYEILQKCLMADVTFICAVSAPSSLAVSLARQFDITLIGFLRDRRLNVYSGHQRVLLDS